MADRLKGTPRGVRLKVSHPRFQASFVSLPHSWHFLPLMALSNAVKAERQRVLDRLSQDTAAG